MQEINHYLPAQMTLDQRLDEAASLLAHGLSGDQSVHTGAVNNRKTESLCLVRPRACQTSRHWTERCQTV